MNEKSSPLHDTFTLTRSYPEPRAAVWNAWANIEAKRG